MRPLTPGALPALAVILNAKKIEDRSRAHGSYQSHDDQHCEQRRREDAQVVANVEHDQLHESSCIQEHAKGQRLTPRLPGPTRGRSCPADLSECGSQEDYHCPEPHRWPVQQIEARAHACQRKEQR